MIVTALAVPGVVGMVLIALRSRFSGRVAAMTGAAAMGVSLLCFILVWEGRVGVSGEVEKTWIEPLNVDLHLGVTALSWPFLLMTALIGVLCCLWLVADDTAPTLVGLVLIISASSMGVFSSLDLLLFFLFFELALIPMWFVIASSPGMQARQAATTFLLFTVGGSALLLVGIVIIAIDGGSLEAFNASTGSLAAAVLVCLGFAVKTPLVPLHTWLPDAHSKAPTVGSVLLAAVFLKLGTYGLILFSASLTSFGDVAPFLALAGAVGIIWSGFACYGQDDLKRLIAYSSIGHMGFVVIAISTQSWVGTAAAVFGSVAHGLITGMLFFVAGGLNDRFGTTSLTQIGRGLYGRTPWLAVTFVFAAVASLGLPGLAGFWGEVLSLRAVYEVGDVLTRPVAWTALGLAVAGIALTTAYFVRAIRLLAQGESIAHDGDRDLTPRETVVLLVLALGVVSLGLIPALLLDLYEPILRGFAR